MPAVTTAADRAVDGCVGDASPLDFEVMGVLPYDMFELARSAADARRFDRMEGIYHKGQSLAWNGRETLMELVDRHHGTHLPTDKRSAMHGVFGPILWGELAAWRISAQLADRIVDLEPKMAATSQAHDEARHFYVLHDYLELATGSVPAKIPPASEKLLATVLDTDHLPSKLLGMQLQVETTALTVFQLAREANLCPVLSDLLRFFERDEARHVGLGLQYLPVLTRGMGRAEGARLSAFALKVAFWLIASNRAMTPSLVALGIDPREVLMLAKSKMMLVFEDLWSVTGKTKPDAGDAVARVLEAAAEAMWPGADASVTGRARAFARGLRRGVAQVPTTIQPATVRPRARTRPRTPRDFPPPRGSC
jgi:rubrerythrin